MWFKFFGRLVLKVLFVCLSIWYWLMVEIISFFFLFEFGIGEFGNVIGRLLKLVFVSMFIVLVLIGIVFILVVVVLVLDGCWMLKNKLFLFVKNILVIFVLSGIVVICVSVFVLLFWGFWLFIGFWFFIGFCLFIGFCILFLLLLFFSE